jgi:aspartate/methionine/tyrosine aminotransferase
MSRWVAGWWRRLLQGRRSPAAWLLDRENDADALRCLARAVFSLPEDAQSAPLPWGEESARDGVIDLRHGAIRSVSFLPPSHSSNALPPPGGCGELRAAVAARYTPSSGISPQHVLITSGGSGALSLALAACLDPGDRVVLFDPCSPLFVWGVRSRRARIAWVPTWVEEGWCRFPRAVLERAIRRARLLILADPVNPTGAVFHPQDREYLAWLAAAHDVLLYVDQAFAELHPQGEAANWEAIPGIRPHLLLAGSLSWSHNLRGWRVGWLIGPNVILRACQALQQLQAAVVPTPCQWLAAHCLKESRPQHERPALFQRWQKQRQQAGDLFQRWGLETGDSGQGGFLWVSTAALGLDGRQWAEVLERDYRLRVLPGELCGPSGRNMVRLGLLQHPGHWEEALNRLTRCLSEGKQRTSPCATAPGPFPHSPRAAFSLS